VRPPHLGDQARIIAPSPARLPRDSARLPRESEAAGDEERAGGHGREPPSGAVLGGSRGAGAGGGHGGGADGFVVGGAAAEESWGRGRGERRTAREGALPVPMEEAEVRFGGGEVRKSVKW
jgi:hypothetical protein